jgi:hypothetical protein
MRAACIAIFLIAATLYAQTLQAGGDPLQPLAFLEGTWDAKAQGNGGAVANGYYAFRLELGNHVLARHSYEANCKGPADFNCEHGDLLYVYADPPGQALKAIFFDNEGHVIHYDVSTPGPATAVFMSDASLPGPQFRLTYTLKVSILSGKFQMHMPGQTEWRSYLEWSGAKK